MKYALIGCSRISDKHLAAARDNGLEICAVADLYQSKTDEVIERNRLDENSIGKYTDHRLMLETEQPKLVSIATGSGSHASIALDCIERGVNVIIEKPMAMSIADANKIIERSKARNVKVAVCHQNRFNPAVQKTHRAMVEGHFGKLSHGSIHVRWNRNRDYYEQASWRGTWKQDGGCLMNQCIHSIDILRWIIGGDIISVCGKIGRRFHSYLEAEDVGLAIVTFSNGTLATIEGTTNVFPRNLEETLYIFGENGTVKLGGKSMNSIEVWNFADEFDPTIEVAATGHSALFKDMIEAMRDDREPYVNAQAGKDALELVLAIYKSSAEGRPVQLPLEDCSTTDFVGLFD